MFGLEVVHVAPTAVHDVALKQLTPLKKLAKAGGVLGVRGRIVQDEPFQVSMRFSKFGPLFCTVSPTAVQNEAPTHDTLSSMVALTPLGEGVTTPFQDDPFHERLHAAVVVETAACPTAMHTVGLLHDMPRTWICDTPVAGGTVDAVQVVPFHCSTKAWLASVAVEPTAKQRDGLVQETAPSVALELAALAPCTTTNPLPFHCRISGDAVLETRSCPTATQKLVVTHETWSSSRSVAPDGTGRAIGDHVEPFHCSAKYDGSVNWLLAPTPRQKLDVTHETPPR
jgi:hypothetical protein